MKREKSTPLTKGEVVIIKDDDRNRAKEKLRIVEELIAGNDGIIRVATLRAGKTSLERAIQQLYPLELSCDRVTVERSAELNLEAPAFRSQRDAAVAASFRIKDIALETDCTRQTLKQILEFQGPLNYHAENID